MFQGTGQRRRRLPLRRLRLTNELLNLLQYDSIYLHHIKNFGSSQCFHHCNSFLNKNLKLYQKQKAEQFGGDYSDDGFETDSDAERWPILAAWRWLIPLEAREARLTPHLDHSATTIHLEGPADLAYRGAMPRELGLALDRDTADDRAVDDDGRCRRVRHLAERPSS